MSEFYGKSRRTDAPFHGNLYYILYQQNWLYSCSAASSSSDKRGKHIAILVFLGALAAGVLILGVFGAYKFWLKKRKEEDQAHFLKLFEDGDDIEDELGLGGVIVWWK